MTNGKSKQMIEFEYYCLDRLNISDEEFTITYDDGNIIKKCKYKIGLQAHIKHIDCFILYTESDEDLDKFIFIPTETFYNNRLRFITEILSITELKTIIKQLTTINIFEYTSLLEFTRIYDDFKKFIEFNWLNLNMDNLIEI